MLEGGNHYGEKSQAGLGGIQSWSGVGEAAILSRVVRIGPTEEVIERGSYACPWRESSRKRGKGSAILQVGEARWKGRRGEWEWLQDAQKSKAIAWSVHEWKAPGKPFLKWWWGHASCLQECVWSQRAARWCQAQFDVWDAASRDGESMNCGHRDLLLCAGFAAHGVWASQVPFGAQSPYVWHWYNNMHLVGVC